MAIAGIHKLTRNPTLYLHSRAILSRATITRSTTTTPSAKVSDRIVKLITYDFTGERREIVGLTGQTLLKALTNNNLIDPASHRLEDIDACSAECEVNIAEEWLEKLPEKSYDESYVLKRNARHRVLNKHSRLGCQVVLTKDMQGMVVAVPEAKPWDTP
uniref:adrenodoxin-like protein 2, mitochondrial n=1 Tax=Erigeron canadensis TaxID=72917 RepID=UPI001CB8AFFD|nr:adrenodoxin-like protein 2, mitochondrial [Erigeron canadensis]